MSRKKYKHYPNAKDVAVFVTNSISGGGAERVVQVMANQLLRGGFVGKVFIISLYRYERQYDLDERVKVIYLSEANPKKRYARSVKELNFELKNIFGKYNVILATTHLPLSHLLVRFSKYSSKFAYVMHGMYGVSAGIVNKWAIRLMYFNQKIVSVSKDFEEYDIKKRFGIRSKYMTFINNPIDFVQIDRRLNKKTTTISGLGKYLLFVGRLAPQKNPIIALESFFASGLYSEYKMVFLGTGDLRKDILQRANVMGIASSIVLMGSVDNPFPFMKNAAALVLSSEYESFAMVAVEAMYCECPVVAYDNGMNCGIVKATLGDDLSYCLAESNTAEAMAEAILRVVNKRPERLKDRILPLVEPNKVIKQYIQKYQEWTSQE